MKQICPNRAEKSLKPSFNIPIYLNNQLTRFPVLKFSVFDVSVLKFLVFDFSVLKFSIFDFLVIDISGFDFSVFMFLIFQFLIFRFLISVINKKLTLITFLCNRPQFVFPH